MLSEFKCTYCGAKGYRPKNKIKERAYCDNACMNAYKRGGVILNQDFLEELVRLREDGWEYKLLSEFFGVDRTTLWKLYEGLQLPSGKIRKE